MMLLNDSFSWSLPLDHLSCILHYELCKPLDTVLIAVPDNTLGSVYILDDRILWKICVVHLVEVSLLFL